MISRRSLFRGLGAILAAPPIAKVAALIPALEVSRVRSVGYLSAAQARRDVVALLRRENALGVFVKNKFDEEFGKDGAKVGYTLRIKLPTDYRVS